VRAHYAASDAGGPCSHSALCDKTSPTDKDPGLRDKHVLGADDATSRRRLHVVC
jgi:hypothetical protein